MENKNIERRLVQFRAVGDTREIIGTAIVFNSPSIDMGYVEVILPDAITQELIDSSDIVMLYNHDEDLVPLARSKNGKGTLKIMLTEDGVDFSFTVRKTSLGDEVLEAVRAGDLESCSFAFAIAEGGEAWSKLQDGTYMRTITKIELLRDFSIVPFPAYQATTVNTRGLDELKAKEELEKRTEEVVETTVEPIVETVNEDLTEYYTQYELILDKLKN
jgi:hypothetical protein